MRVYLASDHAGLALKEAIESHLLTLGHEAIDMGPESCSPEDDYPKLIAPCAQRVAAEEGVCGIIFGGSGQGEAMVANRTKGVRAAVFYGPLEAIEIVSLAREHNNANMLSLGARFIGVEEAKKAVETFLSTPFSNDERHVRRIGQF